MALPLALAVGATEAITVAEGVLPTVAKVATNVLSFLGVSSLIDDVSKMIWKPAVAEKVINPISEAPLDIKPLDFDELQNWRSRQAPMNISKKGLSHKTRYGVGSGNY